MTARDAFILGCLAFGVVTHLMALTLIVRRKIRERRGLVAQMLIEIGPAPSGSGDDIIAVVVRRS